MAPMKYYPELDCYLTGELSDVMFVVNRHRIAANKSLLAIKSPVFRAMFADNWREPEPKEIAITHTTVDAFKVMLRFLYTEQLVLTNERNVSLALIVYSLANKYRLKRLMTRLDQHFDRNLINEVNFGHIYSFANRNKFENLAKIVQKFVANNPMLWICKSVNDLNALNAQTNDTLIQVLVGLYRNTYIGSDSENIIFKFHKLL